MFTGSKHIQQLFFLIEESSMSSISLVQQHKSQLRQLSVSSLCKAILQNKTW